MNGLTALLTAAVSFGVSVIAGILLIPRLRRLHYGQTIREDGPKWHQSKQGTPTMGGLIFISGIVLGSIAGCLSLNASGTGAPLEPAQMVRVYGGLCMALLFGMIGFLDDYISVVKKRNLGLRARQKLLLQTLVTALYLAAAWLAGDRSTVTALPFIGEWDMGWLYYPVMGVLIVGIVNSVNLTDGIDGLCGSVTFVVGIFFMIATSVMGLAGLNVLASALAAGCVGFLVFNVHPAKVFMGDTGSLFLGGMVCALAFGMRMEFILFFCGFVYCCESLSDIIQVCYFKATHGKRIFKMAPIHHHFEMCGWKENKIVWVFSLVTALMSALGLVAVLNR